jgi:2,4-dienoyl-CoA reductase-like NADH-dependent reductase (Old Yellow Enzyme family)
MTTLFDPLQAGALHLPNRIIMAPLTRARAGESRLANGLMADYYAQRAGAGLIVSEATAIAADGYGWKGAPALYNNEQEESWRQVTAAVHDKDGRIVLQLWHMGRVSHPALLDGAQPIAPSAIAAPGFNRSLGKGPDAGYVTPRAMTSDDIKRTIEAYADGARRAIRAGFDGVEIHGANGYLIDQFLKDSANRRTDDYGGTPENRARFLSEVVDAVAAAIGADRTGLRLSPMNGVQGASDSDLPRLYEAVAKMLDRKGPAFLHLREPFLDEQGKKTGTPLSTLIRKHYSGVLILNDGYDFAAADDAVHSGAADAIAFGKLFIANPDLVARLRQRAALNALDMTTLYSGTAAGYVDYPFLKDAA